MCSHTAKCCPNAEVYFCVCACAWDRDDASLARRAEITQQRKKSQTSAELQRVEGERERTCIPLGDQQAVL